MRTQRRTTAADDLRRLITAGNFAPGSRLSEESLSKRLDVSRNTLREAFRVLEAQGLLEHLPNRGVRVQSPGSEDVTDIYRARRWVETKAIATGTPSAATVARLRLSLADADESLAERHWQRVGTANMDFHAGIVSMSGSPRLMQFFRNLAAELRLAFLTFENPEFLHAPYVARNHALLGTLLEHGGAAAAAELDRYLVDSEADVLAELARLTASRVSPAPPGPR